MNMMMILPDKIAYNVLYSFIHIMILNIFLCKHMEKEKQICSGCACWHLQKLFITLTLNLVVNLKHGGNDPPPF